MKSKYKTVACECKAEILSVDVSDTPPFRLKSLENKLKQDILWGIFSSIFLYNSTAENKGQCGDICLQQPARFRKNRLNAFASSPDFNGITVATL